MVVGTRLRTLCCAMTSARVAYQPRVTVISGCIAAGKSTTARALATRSRARGRATACIDLDLVYAMLGDEPKSDLALWEHTRRMCGVLARAFLERGFNYVVLDAAFWVHRGRRELQAELDGVAPVHYVTLVVPYEEALRRAKLDPTRGASKDAEILRGHFDESDRFLREIPAGELVIDTSQASPEEVLCAIEGDE